MKGTLYIVLLFFSAGILSAQVSDKENVERDSVHALIKKTDDKSKIDHFLFLSTYYGRMNTENLDSMKYYAGEALRLSELYKEDEKFVEALYGLGRANMFNGDYNQATTYIERGLALSEEISYQVGLRKGNRNMASILLYQEEYLKGLIFYEKAYELAKANNESKSILFDIAVDLSTEYMILDFSDKSSELLLDVLKFIDDPSISRESKGIFYENMGGINHDSGVLDHALIYFQKALDYYKKDNNLSFQIAPLTNLAGIYSDLNEPQKSVDVFKEALEITDLVSVGPEVKLNIYFGLGVNHMMLEESAKALIYLEKAVEGYKEVGIPFREGMSLLYLADLSHNDKLQAEDYYEKASIAFLESIEKNKSMGIGLARISTSYLSLSQIGSTLGDFKKSLEYYQNFITYRDSVDNETSLKLAERLEFAKEAAKKDKEIALLENQNNLQRYEARQEKSMKIALILIVSLLLLLLIVVINSYQGKRKALEIIREKNEENKLLMREIHHRVKNNLQIILSLINAQRDGHSDNKELEEVLAECQNKIQSMAILHRHLYQGSQFTKVPVNDYIREIIRNVQKTYEKGKEKVQIEINIQQTDIQMGLAVPLGLILNELVTNCYKYAFEDLGDLKNKVSVVFEKASGTDSFRLFIQDNGVGLPADFDSDKCSSFGMQLVFGLVGQLNGKVGVIREGGTAFDIYLEEPVAA